MEIFQDMLGSIRGCRKRKEQLTTLMTLTMKYLPQWEELAEELAELVRREEIDIACVSETHLKEKISNTQLNIDGYITIRPDRQTHMGGLITYVRSNFEFRLINLGHTQLLEYLAIALKGPKTNLLIITRISLEDRKVKT